MGHVIKQHNGSDIVTSLYITKKDSEAALPLIYAKIYIHNSLNTLSHSTF